MVRRTPLSQRDREMSRSCRNMYSFPQTEKYLMMQQEIICSLTIQRLGKKIASQPEPKGNTVTTYVTNGCMRKRIFRGAKLVCTTCSARLYPWSTLIGEISPTLTPVPAEGIAETVGEGGMQMEPEPKCALADLESAPATLAWTKMCSAHAGDHSRLAVLQKT